MLIIVASFAVLIIGLMVCKHGIMKTGQRHYALERQPARLLRSAFALPVSTAFPTE